MENSSSEHLEKKVTLDSDKFDQLLDQLGPDSTDEEKFASLLVLSKTVDSSNNEKMDKLFSSLNFRFLDRLLKQGFKKKSQPEKEGETLPKDSMVAIAVNILTPFFYHEQRSSSDILLARLPLLVANLSCKEVGVSCAILRACLVASTIPRGALSIVCANVPSTEKAILLYIFEAFQIERASHTGANENEFLTLAIQLFERVGCTLVKSDISDSGKVSTCLIKFLALIIEDLHHYFDPFQLKLIGVLVTWYEGAFAKSLFPGELISSEAWAKLHIALQKLLQTPSRSAPRAKALQLCSLLTRSYGFGWLTSQSNNFSSLLIRLAATEVRAGLEEVDLHSTTDVDFLMAGLEFLTHTIQFLTSQPEEPTLAVFAVPSLDQVGLINSNLAQVLLWLRETSKDCLYFMADQKENEMHHPLLLVVLQTLCIYFAEDPGMLEEADSRPLPLRPFFSHIAWCFSQSISPSSESVKSLGLVSPHGARALLQACECGGEAADAVQEHALTFVTGLLVDISSILGQTSLKISHALIVPHVPTLLPSLRAVAAIMDASDKNVFSDPKSKIAFTTIYQTVQDILGEDGPL